MEVNRFENRLVFDWFPSSYWLYYQLLRYVFLALFGDFYFTIFNDALDVLCFVIHSKDKSDLENWCHSLVGCTRRAPSPWLRFRYARLKKGIRSLIGVYRQYWCHPRSFRETRYVTLDFRKRFIFRYASNTPLASTMQNYNKSA